MILAAVVMVILHTASGTVIGVNMNEITSMRNPEPGQPNFTKDARCLINLTDGKYVTVRETCEEVRQIMMEKIK